MRSRDPEWDIAGAVLMGILVFAAAIGMVILERSYRSNECEKVAATAKMPYWNLTDDRPAQCWVSADGEAWIRAFPKR